MKLAARTQPIAVGAGVLVLMAAVYAGQHVAVKWAREADEPDYPQATAYFTAERIAALLEVADEQAGTSGTAYAVKLSNDGSATVSVCFPGAGGLLSYDIGSDGKAVATDGGADCIGGFDATQLGAEPMLAALQKAVDAEYDEPISAAYHAQGGLTPVVEISPADQPVQRFTLGGERVGKIVDVSDPVDVRLALDAVVAGSGVVDLQSVCLDLLEPQVVITGQPAGAQDNAATVSAWRFTNFVQRMPSVTARGGAPFGADELDLAAILHRAPQVETLFESTPRAKKICVESGAAAPLVRYELMNGMRTTAHQVWTTLDGEVVAQE